MHWKERGTPNPTQGPDNRIPSGLQGTDPVLRRRSRGAHTGHQAPEPPSRTYNNGGNPAFNAGSHEGDPHRRPDREQSTGQRVEPAWVYGHRRPSSMGHRTPHAHLDRHETISRIQPRIQKRIPHDVLDPALKPTWNSHPHGIVDGRGPGVNPQARVVNRSCIGTTRRSTVI